MDKNRFFANKTDDPLHFAFDKKISVHPMPKGIPVDFGEIQNIWKNLLLKRAKKQKRVIYIHIPFCETHCLFCEFYQNPYRKEEENYYTDCLIKEMEMVSSVPFVKSHPFCAVYLGGGTPTAFSAKNLLRILKAARKYFPLSNDCEITVEGRIYHFTNDKIFSCLEGGVNRFSVGVQTFNTFVRKKMGRMDDEEQVIQKLNFLNDLDKAVIIIDLIYGFPYQTMDIWEKDIKKFIDLGSESADFYFLNVIKGGRLEKAIKEGILPPVSITNQADMFKRMREIMEREDYIKLSITHWAKTTRERNIYNHLAKSGKVCIPLGSGAGGWFEGYFFYEDNRLKTYYKTIERKEKPIIFSIKEPEKNELIKDIIGEMECGYCNLNKLSKIYNVDLENLYKPLLKQWEEVGLIKTNTGRIKLTLAGEFWYVNLTQGLIDLFLSNQ